ncbi:MAG: AAA family ATPase, partial [Jiangellaceae bacterium]
LYHLATEQTEAVSVRRFAASLADWLGMPRSGLNFDGWEAALTGTASLMVSRAESRGTAAALLILDEFPYLSHETPGLPSIVQALYDEFGPGGPSSAPVRLILCGSAISVMSELLSGTKALRGRGALELRVKPFTYRDARAYWKIDNTEAAFIHHALIGGTPGYRDLVPDPSVPENPARIGEWLARNVLRPSMPLFSEATRVVHEDPRIRDTAVYASLMAVIAAGESSPTKIGGLLGRPSASLSYQLGMLEATGFIERRRNLLVDRRPALSVADPMVRLHHLVIEPHLAELEAGRATNVWDRAQHTVDSKILGPHFESIAIEWVSRHARDEAGIDVGIVGQATVACRAHKTSHEIDVLAFEPGARSGAAPAAGIRLIGEARSRDRAPGVDQLERLQHIRDVLGATGSKVDEAALGVFSRAGFGTDVASAATRSRGRTLLVGLDHLYGETTRGLE